MLSYADYLLSDPELWRLTVVYMCTCGDVGKEMADEVLIRVPLNLEPPKHSTDRTRREDANASTDDEMDVQLDSGDLAEVVRELNATCFEYQREHVRRMICKVSRAITAPFGFDLLTRFQCGR